MNDQRGLNRRTFLGAAGGAAAVGVLGSYPALAGAHGGKGKRHDRNGKGGDLPLKHLGIQLFTVRDLLADNELDLPGTFEMLNDAGYAEVEIGGTYDGRTAADFRALAEAVRPEAGGQPRPRRPRRLARQPQAVLDDAEALGLRYVGIARPPQGTPQTHDGYKALADEFNAFGQAARDRGLKFYFHNHPTDFALDGGTPIYDTLLAETDPRLVWFELDIAWIEAGGQSADDYVKAHGTALPAVPRQGPPLGRRRAARDAGQRRAAEPHVLARSTSARATSTSRASSRRCATPTPPLLRRARRRAGRRDGRRHLAAPAQPGRLGEHGVDEPQVPRGARHQVNAPPPSRRGRRLPRPRGRAFF